MAVLAVAAVPTLVPEAGTSEAAVTSVLGQEAAVLLHDPSAAGRALGRGVFAVATPSTVRLSAARGAFRETVPFVTVAGSHTATTGGAVGIGVITIDAIGADIQSTDTVTAITTIMPTTTTIAVGSIVGPCGPAVPIGGVVIAHANIEHASLA